MLNSAVEVFQKKKLNLMERINPFVVQTASSQTSVLSLWWMSAYLIERTPDVNRAVLNDLVHNFRDRLGEVRVGKLGS